MRIALLATAMLLLGQPFSEAATRTWKDRKGNEIKADFTGVLNGKVTLKAAGRRMYVNLRDLSLADRDFIVSELTKRDNSKDKQQLLQLMAAENQVPVIDPDAVKPNATVNGSTEGYTDTGSMPTRPINPITGRPFGVPPSFPTPPNFPMPPDFPGAGSTAPQQPAEEIPTEMYGLELPSPELLAPDKVRTWTSLTGDTQLATFDRVLAPGFFRLKKADGSTGTFAMVNFSKADIDYVKQVLADDLARPIFPEGSGFQSLTPDDVSKGYRVWTDRKQVPLIGKFVATKAKSVVIERNGEETEYPLAGLSEADQKWINDETKRRNDAARQAAQQAANDTRTEAPRSSTFGQSRFGQQPQYGSNPGGHGETASSSTSRFNNNQNFNNNQAFNNQNNQAFNNQPGHTFGVGGGHSDGTEAEDQFAMNEPDQTTNPFDFGAGGGGSTATGSPFQYEFNCEHCGRTWTDVSPISSCSNCAGKYHFKCDRCGHSWTRSDKAFDKCPECSKKGGVGGVASYVVIGFMILGGIIKYFIRSLGD